MAKKKSKKARAQATEKVVMEWERYMGEGSLADWQRLMRDLGFEEEFPSKNQCRKVSKREKKKSGKKNHPPLPPSLSLPPSPFRLEEE